MVNGWKENSEDVIIDEKTQTEEDGWNIRVSAEAADCLQWQEIDLSS